MAALAGEEPASPDLSLEAEVQHLREQLAAAERLLDAPGVVLQALRAHDFDLDALGEAYCWMPPAEFLRREAEWSAQLAASKSRAAALEIQLEHSGDMLKAAIEAMDPETATARERARCRAIVWRHFADDFRGNEALREIDQGPEALESGEPVG